MSITKPSASVVISVYQQREFLPWILAALKVQDYSGPWEILVCDDGSSQDMLGIVKQAASELPVKIRYIWQPDIGFTLSASRNNAIRCATGEVLIFIDGDIVVPPNFVREHVAAHDGSLRFVTGSRSYLFLNKFPDLNVPALLSAQRYDLLSRYAKFPSAVFQNPRATDGKPWLGIIGCNFSIWRNPSVLFDEDFIGWGFEDTEYALRVHNRHHYEIVFRTDILVYHLERSMPGRFDPCRPKTGDEIGLYIKNIVRLANQFPELELKEIWQDLLLFAYDPQADCWGRVSGQYQRNLEEVRAVALAWVKQQSVPDETRSNGDDASMVNASGATAHELSWAN